MSIEGRLTVSNMSIEGRARRGLFAPDEKTFAYVKDRPLAPKGAEWDAAVAYRRTTPTAEGAHLDAAVYLAAAPIERNVTCGTSHAEVVPITGEDPNRISDTRH